MNAALKIKKLEEQIKNLKIELRAAKAESFENMMDLALGEHLEMALSRNWRTRMGTYPKATDEDLVKFHAIMGQPKFAGPLYFLAMGVMHRLLDAETSHHLFSEDSVCHGFNFDH